MTIDDREIGDVLFACAQGDTDQSIHLFVKQDADTIEMIYCASCLIGSISQAFNIDAGTILDCIRGTIDRHQRSEPLTTRERTVM